MKPNIFFKSIAYTIILFCVGTTVSAQMTQKIGGNPFYMEPTAVLELESTTKGFLLPRMTQIQMNAIPSPPSGMMVYCTDCGSGIGELRVRYTSSWGIPAINLSGDVTAAVNGSGSNVTTIGASKVVSSMIDDGTIVDADVNAAAAVAGTKIVPNFGSQNVVTIGTLGAGATSLTTLSTSGAATLNSAAVTNNATVGGTLGVTGATSLTTLGTSGLATLNSAAVTNNATVGGTLGVTGTTTTAAINATNVAASGTLGVTGATSLSTLGTSGAATLNSAAITNNATIGGTLGVTGATSLTTLGTSGAATLNSAAVTNNATVGGTLGVTGATSLSTLGTSGLATLNSAAVTNNATVGGTLAVTGTTTAAAINATNVAASGTLGVTGATTTAGITNTGTLTNTGDATVSGTLGVTGATTLQNVQVTGTASIQALAVTGTASLNAGFTVDVNKFSVQDNTGNTAIAGTLGVTGVSTFTAQPILSSLTASQAVFTDASKGLVSNAITGTGDVVMSTSPTLVTPVLGAATATSVNGTSIPSSKTLVVTTDKLNALSATTSAELAGVISDETGTGTLVLSASPTFTGTPTLPTGTIGVTQTAGDNTTKLATTAFVTGAASSSKFVDLTTAQTVAGVKTFSSGIQVGSINFLAPSGSQSTYIGGEVVGSAGNNVTALGFLALDGNTGDSNTAIGVNALRDSGNTLYNTAVGVDTGQKTSGGKNTFIGHGATLTSDGTIENSTAIGYQASVATSNTIQLGNAAITNVKTSGTLTADAVTYPKAHGTSGQVLSTTGSGTLAWTDSVNTNANLTGMVTSVGNAASLGSFTSANLLAAVSDETGTGAAVFANSPTLVTPILGVATATSVNKLTITAPATSATLTIADGGTLATAGAFSQTLTATGATNVTLPTTGTLATLAGTETLSNKTLTTPVLGVATATSVNGTTIPSSKTLVVTTDKLSALSATTSAELAGVISDETGTGAAVFANSPTLVTPTLGAATATTLTTTNLVAGTNTYPTIQGTNGQVLMTNGSGTLSWGTPAASVTEVADEYSATAAQVSFTLTATPSALSKVKMYINGVRISKNAHSVTGTTLTYTPANNGSYALVASDRIQIDYFY